MSQHFKQAADRTLKIEGKYSDHPSDKGGPTMWGITEAVARANGYHGDMRDLPKEMALQIYCNQYWDIQRLDSIAELSQPIAEEIFDTGVNCGVVVAGKMFQVALNALNVKGTLYYDIKEDGMIGPGTIAAFRTYLSKRGSDGEVVMLRILNSLQGAHYISISRSREENEDFVFGWFLQRVVI